MVRPSSRRFIPACHDGGTMERGEGADLSAFGYERRRRPLFPFEPVTFSP